MTDNDDDDCNKCDQKTGCCWLMMRPAGHSHSFTRPPATITKPGLRGNYVDDHVIDDDIDEEEDADGDGDYEDVKYRYDIGIGYDDEHDKETCALEIKVERGNCSRERFPTVQVR